MAKAKIGTGELTPFRKGDCGSTTIESSKSKHGATRSGFFPNIQIDHTGGPQTQTNPSVGRMGWRQKQGYERGETEQVPKFHTRDNGIGRFPPFSDKET